MFLASADWAAGAVCAREGDVERCGKERRVSERDIMGYDEEEGEPGKKQMRSTRQCLTIKTRGRKPMYSNQKALNAESRNKQMKAVKTNRKRQR